MYQHAGIYIYLYIYAYMIIYVYIELIRGRCVSLRVHICKISAHALRAYICIYMYVRMYIGIIHAHT